MEMNGGSTMGSDLIITKSNGEYVVDIGRAYNYQNLYNDIDIDRETLEYNAKTNDEYMIQMLQDFKAFVDGREDVIVALKKMDMMDDEYIDKLSKSDALDLMFDNLVEAVYQTGEENLQIGKKMLLSQILEEETLAYRISG
jgi:hypothetical protein